MSISKNLHLDVPGLLDVFLQVETAVLESQLRVAPWVIVKQYY
jgi:hypothetical protein